MTPPPLSRPQRGFTLIELMIVVAILGLLAVVAIPAFVRYMRVAKTAEAYRMINKIIKGVQSYYETPHFASDGSRLPCVIAHGGSSPVTPDRGTCCSEGEADGKCEPNETRWDTEAWNAKLFKISDKHYYSYGSGYDGANQATATQGYTDAYGDLDCDGTYSSFFAIVVARRNADTITNCRTYKQGSFTVLNETE